MIGSPHWQPPPPALKWLRSRALQRQHTLKDIKDCKDDKDKKARISALFSCPCCPWRPCSPLRPCSRSGTPAPAARRFPPARLPPLPAPDLMERSTKRSLLQGEPKMMR